MKRLLTIPPCSELLTWSRPKSSQVPQRSRQRYDARVSAVEAVIKGSTLQAAAKLYGVDRDLLAKILADTQKLDEKGQPFGFRACLPWARTGPAVPRSTEAPLAAAPHALAQLLQAVPSVAKLVDDFKGELPTRNRQSRAFNRLMSDFKRALESANLGHAYPLNTPDKGRRALLECLKRIRRREMEHDIARPTDAPVSATRLDQMMVLQPFDRAEIDEHWTDVKWHALVPTPQGLWHSVPLSGLWFIALIDAVLPMCYAWTIVIGRGFNHQDFLRVQAKALTPWQPRELIVQGLTYDANSWMPNAASSFDQVLRPASLAADNHASHSAKVVVANSRDHQVGVINHGYPEVPQGRPNIEAFFKYMEEAVFRPLAGGFRPAKALNEEPERTSKLNPADYPIDLIALEDVIDVHVSRFHVTSRPSLQNRSVREVVEAQFAAGMWPTQSRLTETDAADLVAEHFIARVCGNPSTNDLPHVNYLDGTYRDTKLDKRTNLIGEKYRASVSFSDASKMTLYDENGNVFVILQARPPWSRPHTLEQRRRARQWLKRGIFRVDEDGDAIAAYHRCVKDRASKLTWAADLFLKEQGGRTTQPTSQSQPSKSTLPPDTMKGITPRGGHIGLLDRGTKK